MSDDGAKPVVALILPMVGVGAAFILILGARYLFLDTGSTAARASKAPEVIGRPKLVTVLKGGEGSVPAGAQLVPAPDGDFLFAAGGNILSVRSRGWLLDAPDPALGSFAVTPEGLVVTVRGPRLGYLAGRAVADRVGLPGDRLRLEPAGRALVLWGPVGERMTAVYLLDRGRYSKLFTFPGEISALSGSADGLLFAAAGAVYRADFGGRLSPVVYLPARPAIRSLAWDASRRAVFFSTTDSVYVVVENRLFRLVRGVAGSLRAAPEGLYILSDKSQELVRVEGIFKKA